MKFNVFKLTFISLLLSIYTLVWSENNLDNDCYTVIRSDDGKTYLKKYYCCNNHERRNGICVECRTGYISQNEEKCMPCPLNSYGERCALTCTSCPEDRCHHIIGCLRDDHTDHNQITSSDAATTSPDRVKTTTSSRRTIGRNDPMAGSSQFTTIDLRTTPEKDFANQHIIVYTACTAGLLLVITFCYAFLHYIRNKVIVIKQRHDIQGIEQQIQQGEVVNNQSSVNVHAVESMYDDIDEQNIREAVQVVQQNRREIFEIASDDSDIEEEQEESNSESNDSRSGGTDENRSYLNPYQPMVPDQDLHNYSQTEFESSCNAEASLVYHDEDRMLDDDGHQFTNQSLEELCYSSYKAVSNDVTYLTVIDFVSNDFAFNNFQNINTGDTKIVNDIDDKDFVFQSENPIPKLHEHVYSADDTATNITSAP